MEPTAKQFEDSDETYIYIDHVENLLIPWKLVCSDDGSVLAKEHLRELARKFDLDPSILEELSSSVNTILDRSSALIQAYPVQRRETIQKGKEKVADAFTKMKRGVKNCEDAFAGISDLCAFPGDPTEINDYLHKVRHKSTLLKLLLTEFLGDLEAIASMPVADLRYEKRQTDFRRRSIVRACCDAWHASGRKVSFASREVPKNERYGPLMEFIQCVVSKATDPETTVGNESIRKDIDHYKANYLGKPYPEDLYLDDTQRWPKPERG